MPRSRELAELATSYDSGGLLGFRNRIINGAMAINQRNTTLSTNSSQGYSVDRMWGFSGGSTAATFSQISSTGLAGFPFAIRCQRTAGNTGTNGVYMGQIVESNNLQDLQGQSVTISFWARAGSNYSPTSSVLNVYLRTGTVADQGLNTLISPGWTGVVQQSSGVTLTTSWQFFSRTFSVASNAQELSAFFEAPTTGTAGANDFYDITGFQLEAGSVATPFERRDYGRELMMCQRYYYRIAAGTAGQIFGSGFNQTTTTSSVVVPYPVQMRTAPSTLEQTGTAGDYRVNNLGGATTCSVVPVFAVTTTNVAYVSFTTGATLIAGQGIAGSCTNATAYLAWSAEL
jgi:hypothetical protein